MSKKNLILRYGYCTVCGLVEDLTVFQDSSIVRITWDNSLQSFTKYRIKLIFIGLDNTEIIVRDEEINLKYVS